MTKEPCKLQKVMRVPQRLQRMVLSTTSGHNLFPSDHNDSGDPVIPGNPGAPASQTEQAGAVILPYTPESCRRCACSWRPRRSASCPDWLLHVLHRLYPTLGPFSESLAHSSCSSYSTAVRTLSFSYVSLSMAGSTCFV